MKDFIKGLAIVVILAIVIFLIWCFLLGGCKGRISFGVVPPRPSLNVRGRGSGNAGAQGSGRGGSGVNPSGGNKPQENNNKGCGFWDLGCKLAQAWKNITEGKTIFGSASPFPNIAPRIPIVVP